MVTTDGYSPLELLGDFGLTENEARAYLALLGHPGSIAREVALRSGVPRPKAYTALSGLQRKGFILAVSGPVQRFHAVAAEEALGSVVREQQQRVEHLRRTRDDLAARLAATADGSRAPPQAGQFITLRGREDVRRVTDRALARADDRVVWANDAMGVIRTYRANRAQLAALARRGVEVRGLAMVNAHNREQARALSGLCELRTMEQVPLRLWSTPAEVILGLVATPDTRLEGAADLGIWTTNPSFVGAIWELFDGWWERAAPLV